MKKSIVALATCVLLTAGCSKSPEERGGSTAFESRYEPLPLGTTLITGATVLLGNGERLDGADVLIRDGKIAEVGTSLGAGDALDITVSGPPGQDFIILVGPLNRANDTFAGLGQLDLGLLGPGNYSDIAVAVDGITGRWLRLREHVHL